ncbi:MAG TPA: DNA repair ATPase, partial [Cytophagaceae bacterium]
MSETSGGQPKEVKETNQLDSGTYEILRSRLQKGEQDLRQRLDKLNLARKDVFGSIDTRLIATERITTEHNCVPRDMVSINNYLLFGYNVHMGLKMETVPSDVLSIYEFKDMAFHDVGLEKIKDQRFESDFKELYKYYKNTVFEKFAVLGPYLYMVFRVGKTSTDIKTFKWLIKGNELIYENNRSDHEFKYPAQFGFEWKRTSRDYHRKGKHPHVSVLDKVFIETIGGDLTIKIEDNTDVGEGIYSEPVEDKDQRLDDAEMYYADLGNIILLKIKPFKEDNFRYIVYNHKIKKAQRIDAIKDACILLPDDHGIIFSKGYYLQTGEFKQFDNDLQDLKFEKCIASSNGEDYLFVFYQQELGAYALLPYNLIEQKVENITVCHGYSFFPNGELIYFTSQNEPLKHHVIQIWQTPFVGKDYIPPVHSDSYLYKIGNKDIVRCMAECHEVLSLLAKDDESYANLYLDLVKKCGDIKDSYFWIREESTHNLAAALTEIKSAASAAIEEFEKVIRIKRNTQEQIKKYSDKTKELLNTIKHENFESIEPFVKILADIRTTRGEVISLKELRYADLEAIEKMEVQLSEQASKLSQNCVQFLLQEHALQPYKEKVITQKEAIDKVQKVTEANKTEEELGNISKELELLIDTVSNLKIEDATETSRIIDNISIIFADLNGLKSTLKNKKKDLGRVESTAEFHSQIKLVEQAIVNYLDVSDTPERCDEYLTKLMVQLEELEGKFADFEEFIQSLTEKREEVYEAFETRKLQIIEARNTKASSLSSAAERILKGIQNKAASFKTASEINGYFASDLMVEKVRDIIKQLQELNDPVKSDDIQSKLKTAKEDAIRQLKDKQELFVDGANVVKFGSYHFSVNVQPLDLTIIPKDGEMYFHLTGTNFFEKITDPEFATTKPVWNQTLISENETVYRSEYLAYKIYQQALAGKTNLNELLLMNIEELQAYVQKFMASRYSEGYTKGVHDKDATLILEAVLRLHKSIDLLRYSTEARSLAKFYWNHVLAQETKEQLNRRIKGFGIILKVFPDTSESRDMIGDLETRLTDFSKSVPIFSELYAKEAANYLFNELIRGDHFIVSQEAAELYELFTSFLLKEKIFESFKESLAHLDHDKVNQFDLVKTWLNAFVENEQHTLLKDAVVESTTLFLSQEVFDHYIVKASTKSSIEGMVGSHSLLREGIYQLDFNRFMKKLEAYERDIAPLFERYIHLKNHLIEQFKEELRLNEFKPRVLSSFVRNKLIDEVYLPLIGANLAKQIGVVGENKRTDLMGMLLLISPPGYGKTTLMEYIASRLGIIFMKINGPAIGHKITSVDPAEAVNASAREELEKLNLAFEMGDNVMIYIDDIQHCNPEFLQKFISMCDAQRKIEGVYKGRPKTYDFRGKKVCVVMAGNPYTETGEKFQIPDMLANRADTYNLGDIIGDKDEVFKLSYIENSLTSNPVLGKLANKSIKDVYAFLKIASTGDKTGLDFEGSYSAEEANEYVSLLEKIVKIRDVILKVNQEYIYSASQAEEYRTEPAFKLQGSYRNMNKLTEKVVSLMNEQELKSLILSHYEGEVQTLTNGAEANILKFKELVGWQSDEDKERWEAIKATFRKNQKMRGIDANNQVGMVVAQLSSLSEGVDGIKSAIEKANVSPANDITEPSKQSKEKNKTNTPSEDTLKLLLTELVKTQKLLQEQLGTQASFLQKEKEAREAFEKSINENEKKRQKEEEKRRKEEAARLEQERINKLSREEELQLIRTEKLNKFLAI